MKASTIDSRYKAISSQLFSLSVRDTSHLQASVQLDTCASSWTGCGQMTWETWPALRITLSWSVATASCPFFQFKICHNSLWCQCGQMGGIVGGPACPLGGTPRKTGLDPLALSTRYSSCSLASADDIWFSNFGKEDEANLKNEHLPTSLVYHHDIRDVGWDVTWHIGSIIVENQPAELYSTMFVRGL